MKTTILALGALLLLAGCNKEVIDPQNTATGSPGYNAAGLLANTANTVMVANYRDLDQQAAALQTAVGALAAAPTAATLDAARQAYRTARLPWETTEAFAFGPVSTLGLDAVIDTWPLNRVDLATLLASADPLTAASLTRLDGGLQGYHPIEFLLFGKDAGKALTDFTPREYQFLTASAQNLKTNTAKLLNAWLPGGNFAATLATAGPGNAVYPKQKQAVQELLDGLVGPADELANSKIETPLAKQSTDYEEAEYSQNSKAEFTANLAGIENIYNGRYGSAGTGAGFGALVAARNPTLDARFRQELADAKTAINALPGRFDQAIIQNPAAVRAAQAKVRTVLNTLQNDCAPLVNAL